MQRQSAEFFGCAPQKVEELLLVQVVRSSAKSSSPAQRLMRRYSLHQTAPETPALSTITTLFKILNWHDPMAIP